MSDLATLDPAPRAGQPSANLPPNAALAGEIPARRSRWISRQLATELVAILDAALILAASVISGTVYSKVVLGHWGQTATFFGVGALAALLLVGNLHAAGYYSFERFFALWGQIRPLLIRWPLILLVLIAVAFLTKTSADHSRGWVLSWAILGALALSGSRPLVRAAFRHFSTDGKALRRNVAVVGATSLANAFRERVKVSREPVRILGTFDDAPEGGAVPGVQPIEALVDRTLAGEVDEIVVALSGSHDEEVTSLIRRLSYLAVPIHICPDEVALRYQHRDHVSVGGVTVLEANPRPLCGWPGIAKDVFDFVASAGLLVVLSPLLLLIAAAVKLDSRGPVLFKQRRHGFNHGTFWIYKFRTMTCQEDGTDVKQATKDDARITRVGGFLRRSSLDELPQLLNVLLGEMSLIGPRPHALSHNDEYSGLIEDYACRHRVRPGITGWAQVNGLRGETATPELMAKRLEHDLYYIENWSAVLDLKILALTIRALLAPKNAY